MSTKDLSASVDEILTAAGLDNLGDDPSTEAIEVVMRRLSMAANGAERVLNLVGIEVTSDLR